MSCPVGILSTGWWGDPGGGYSWWFGSSCSSGLLVVWHSRLWSFSPWPSFKPFPRNGDVSCCGYFHSRGGHLHNNKKKLNAASAEQAESVPLVHVGMLEHGNIRESCSETLSGWKAGENFVPTSALAWTRSSFCASVSLTAPCGLGKHFLIIRACAVLSTWSWVCSQEISEALQTNYAICFCGKPAFALT